MVELNKRDLEAVARRRFFRQYRRLIYGLCWGWVAYAFGLAFGTETLVPGGFSPQLVLLIVGMALPAGIGMWFWAKKENRAVALFLEECQKARGIVYIGDVKIIAAPEAKKI